METKILKKFNSYYCTKCETICCEFNGAFECDCFYLKSAIHKYTPPKKWKKCRVIVTEQV